MFKNLSISLIKASVPLRGPYAFPFFKGASQKLVNNDLYFKTTSHFGVVGQTRIPSLTSLKKISSPPLATYSEFVSAGIKHMSGLDTKTAHRCFQKALKISVDLFGEKSKNAAVCLNYLAQNSQLEGNIKNSLKFYNEALNIASDSSQLNYLLISDIHHDINVVYQTQGNLTRAQEHAEVSLMLLQGHFPEEYKRQSLILLSLGHICTLMNRLSEAKTYLFQSHDILTQNKQKDTPEFGLLCDKIATLFEKEDNHVEAVKYRKEALKLNDDPQISSGLFNQYLNLAALYAKLNKNEESLKCLEKAYEHLENDNSSQNDIHRGPLLIKLGQLYLKAGKKTLAIRNLEESLKYLCNESIQGQKMIEKVERMLNQAKLLKNEGELRIDKLKESLSAMMESSVTYDLEDAEGYRDLGYSYMQGFDRVSAYKAFIRALQIFSSIKGPDCKECAELKKLLENYNLY